MTGIINNYPPFHVSHSIFPTLTIASNHIIRDDDEVALRITVRRETCMIAEHHCDDFFFEK